MPEPTNDPLKLPDDLANPPEPTSEPTPELDPDLLAAIEAASDQPGGSEAEAGAESGADGSDAEISGEGTSGEETGKRTGKRKRRHRSRGKGRSAVERRSRKDDSESAPDKPVDPAVEAERARKQQAMAAYLGITEKVRTVTYAEAKKGQEPDEMSLRALIKAGKDGFLPTGEQGDADRADTLELISSVLLPAIDRVKVQMLDGEIGKVKANPDYEAMKKVRVNYRANRDLEATLGVVEEHASREVWKAYVAMVDWIGGRAAQADDVLSRKSAWRGGTDTLKEQVARIEPADSEGDLPSLNDVQTELQTELDAVFAKLESHLPDQAKNARGHRALLGQKRRAERAIGSLQKRVDRLTKISTEPFETSIGTRKETFDNIIEAKVAMVRYRLGDRVYQKAAELAQAAQLPPDHELNYYESLLDRVDTVAPMDDYKIASDLKGRERGQAIERANDQRYEDTLQRLDILKDGNINLTAIEEIAKQALADAPYIGEMRKNLGPITAMLGRGFRKTLEASLRTYSAEDKSSITTRILDALRKRDRALYAADEQLQALLKGRDIRDVKKEDPEFGAIRERATTVLLTEFDLIDDLDVMNTENITLLIQNALNEDVNVRQLFNYEAVTASEEDAASAGDIGGERVLDKIASGASSTDAATNAGSIGEAAAPAQSEQSTGLGLDEMMAMLEAGGESSGEATSESTGDEAATSESEVSGDLRERANQLNARIEVLISGRDSLSDALQTAIGKFSEENDMNDPETYLNLCDEVVSTLERARLLFGNDDTNPDTWLRRTHLVIPNPDKGQPDISNPEQIAQATDAINVYLANAGREGLYEVFRDMTNEEVLEAVTDTAVLDKLRTTLGLAKQDVADMVISLMFEPSIQEKPNFSVSKVLDGVASFLEAVGSGKQGTELMRATSLYKVIGDEECFDPNNFLEQARTAIKQ